jgi:hypothetical protein
LGINRRMVSRQVLFDPFKHGALLGGVAEAGFDVDVADGAGGAEAGEGAVVLAGGAVLEDGVERGVGEAVKIGGAGGEDEIVRCAAGGEGDALADGDFVFDGIAGGIIVEGDKEAAGWGQEGLKEGGAAAVEPVECGGDAGGGDVGVEQVEVSLGSGAGEHPVGVELKAAEGDVAGVAGDEESAAGAGGHVGEKGFAGGLFIAVNEEVAAGGWEVFDDVEFDAGELAAAGGGGEQGRAGKSEEGGEPAAAGEVAQVHGISE